MNRFGRVARGPSALILVVVAVWPSSTLAVPRESVSLDGQWEMVKVPSLDAPPPETGWREFRVPGTLRGHDYQRAWFRRTFDAPATWEGKRCFVRFGGVKYNSCVFVNGSEVGGCFNGYDAFELDITAAVRPGESNELRVGVHDWTGVFTEERVDFGEARQRREVRSMPIDRVLAPIGGHVDVYGIWDTVGLVATPPTYLTDLFVKPSVREKRIDIDVTVVNAGPGAFEATVEARFFEYDGGPRDATGTWPAVGEPVVAAAGVPVTVAPGARQAVTLSLNEPPLKLWWPHSPTLYVLELRVGEDRLRERVGYRELWCEGPDFFLNGAKVHLLATSWWPPYTPPSREEVEQKFRGIKAMNAFCFRTHTQPWHEIWYEVADELGVLMIPEGAIWNDDAVYRLNDPRFWDHYAAHLKAMVHRLRNHPSVIMWSLENEFHGGRAKDDTPAEEELARMGRIVKDKGLQPVVYESDGDPGGVADVIGLHYPNEYPARRCWPNDAYWMDEPSTSWTGNMFWDEPAFLWKRDKPLYIGEFLWAPARDPSGDTVFFGDEAYSEPRKFHNLAKAESWRMQILAYRHYGVSGISPWTVIEHGPLDERNFLWEAQRDLYRPLAAFIREYDRRFFAGEVVERTVELFNDTMADHLDTRLLWELRDEDRVVRAGEEKAVLPCGAREKRTLRIVMPDVRERTDLALRLILNSGSNEQFREEWPIEVFPRTMQWSLPDTRLFLHDPEGTLAEAWERDGVTFTLLEELDAWPGGGVLVVGPGALRAEGREAEAVPVIGSPKERRDALSRKVSAGGRVLVLEQTVDASDWLPVQISAQESTIAHVQMLHHPVLRGLKPADFRWWRGDQFVSACDPARPLAGAGKPLVMTGGARGIAHAPLLEVPQGDGVWLVCQLKVVSKLETEPVARGLLENMVAYLAAYERPVGRTVCVGPASLLEQLEQTRVDYEVLANDAELAWPETQLLVLETDPEGDVVISPEKLRTFLNAGGNVLWHRPTPETLEALCEVLDMAVTMQPCIGSVTRAEGDGALLEALTREDLFWLGEHRGHPWHTTPLAHDMARGVFGPKLDPSQGRQFEAEKEVELEGKYVGIRDGEVVFATVGKAAWEVEIPETGRYVLGLVARGTPVDDVYPTAEVRLDGARVGTVYVGARELQPFTLDLRAERGARRLSVAFTNDATSATEDRNLYLDKLVLAAHSDDRIEPLTTPAALVRVSVGRGNLVLDAIRWDDAGRNAARAQRFISSLLLALGARFHGLRTVDIVEAETLTPQPNLAHFRREDTQVCLGTTGYIEGPVRIATAGRYRIGLWARGTAADGVYPIVAVALDGQGLGVIECVGEAWGMHSFVADLPAGEGTLRVAFTNDLYRPPEDRNLCLDRIEFERVGG